MKTFSTDLLENVGNTYDKTRTTRLGLVTQKLINDEPVLGPPLSKFIDVFTDTLGTFVPGFIFLSPNGRLYALQSVPASGLANTIVCYDFNLTTGEYIYRGRISFSIAAPATISVRGFKVEDSDGSNIKILIGYTSTTVITGGLLLINKVQLADFVPVGFPTIFTAISNDVKGVYLLQAPTERAALNLMTNVAGISIPNTSSNSTINTKVYVHNGVSATHQFYAFDFAIAPQIAAMGTSTVTSANTTGATTAFNMTGNTLQINDTVVITSNAPTGFTNSTNSTVQTVYYVVAANFVAGSAFSLSATLGGAVVQATATSATTTFVRALGCSTNQFFGKTANLPALTGTLLLTNSEDYAKPNHTTNINQDCVYFATSTTQYLGKYTDLFLQLTGTLNGTINVTSLASTSNLSVGQFVTGNGIPLNTTVATIVSGTAITLSQAATVSGATSLVFGASLWAGLVNSNVLGNGIDYASIVPLNAQFSSFCDCAIFNINGIFCLTKKFVNSVIQSSVGVGSQVFLEAQNHVTDQFSLSTVGALETRTGWLFASSTAIGQRGIVFMHLLSDAVFDFSAVITKVIRKQLAQLSCISTIEQLYDATGSCVFYVRSAATETDSIFNTAQGGWVLIESAQDLSSINVNEYMQFKMLFALSSSPGSFYPSVTTPTQLADFLYCTESQIESSDNWEYSYNASSSAIPTRVGFVLRSTYSTAVPTLRFKAFNDTGSSVITDQTTLSNAANFEYSINNGTSWLPLGTIPNVVGTLLRYTYTTPPGVDIRVALQEV